MNIKEIEKEIYKIFDKDWKDSFSSYVFRQEAGKWMSKGTYSGEKTILGDINKELVESLNKAERKTKLEKSLNGN